ncbi:hypothetical protein KUV62_22565 [Salipiger bermudensis]|uniref:hypothetical protein n=1 Tax=Salipiger bermudensis TaxID=344736 RepID=UPI001C991F5D|nr:hypothetical protein [Salipiger bermudensis]MBY6006717.1 hypothetical protein [Salipiger bermudensis]
MEEPKASSSYLSVLDIDGDGKVDIQDFLALFGSRGKAINQIPALENRVAEAWRRKSGELEKLSTAIRGKVDSGSSLAKKSSFSLADRRMNSILKRLQLEFDDDNLEKLRGEYLKCLAAIKEAEGVISDLIASSALVSGNDRGKVEKKLERARALLQQLKGRRQELISDFVQSFSIYNVKISTDQAEVLLSRIDSGDVTRMTSVFAIVAQLTAQFAEAKQASGENTSTAQKYYAMYIGLLELQELVQSEYIERMDKSYLPGISEIKRTAEQLIAETQVLMKNMPIDHLRSYEHNLQSQEFTLEVASVYEDALLEDRARAVQAREIVRNLLRLAENTLKTVKVASDLVSLMKDSQGLYDEVMQLQTPSLVPFENLELKREFEAVTEKLKSSS